MQRFLIHHRFDHGSEIYFVESNVDIRQLNEEEVLEMCEDLGIPFDPNDEEELDIKLLDQTTFVGWKPNGHH